MSSDLFAREALSQIPKILTLLDRNVHSPTYGCFDRNFWHYKIIDFPSGMAQEFVWPLALAYKAELPGNPFYREENIRKWAIAGIRFAATSSHPDGSCDDYFPYEKAGGATAFSLLACIESYLLLGLNDPVLLRFFEKRGEWLAGHHESGRLTNHQALILLCLELLSRMLGIDRWESAISSRLQRVLSWQDEEGWFQEYEGCDPGYQTLTIYCLARIHQLNPDQRLKEALEKAVRLASCFIHPDGSFGGEYASRNTYNYFPAGFELAGRWMPEALSINDRFLEGLNNGLGPCYADDHIIGHHTWNYLLAWREFVPERPPLAATQKGMVWLKNAGLVLDRREGVALFLSLNKGGCFKLFRDGRLAASDTQFSLRVREGNRLKNAVGHLVGDYHVRVGDGEIVIEGMLGWAKQKQMTPFNLLALRCVMLTIGRFFPDLVRKLLQKVLITGKREAPYRFKRRFQWVEGTLNVRDELHAPSWENVVDAAIGCDQTSIYVVMSRTFQRGQLLPWLSLTDKVKSLKEGEPLVVERTF